MRADEKRTKRLIRERSGGLCEVCLTQRATNASHRIARGQGGPWSPANCVDACGSGTTGCHGWIEANPEAARRLGLRLQRHEDPLTVPVDLARPGRVVLDDDGGYAFAPPIDDPAPLLAPEREHPMTEQTAPLAFIDTETDGVHPGREVWEVAIVRRDPDGTHTEWQAFANIDLSTADPFGLKVGRFYDRHPMGRALSGQPSADAEIGYVAGPAYSLSYIAREVARLTHGAHLVGAVPNFDAEVLDRILRDNQLCPAWHYHLVDIENLAVGYLAGQGTPPAPPWKSDALTEALGVDPTPEDERHTAMGDVRWAMRVYDRVMGRG